MSARNLVTASRSLFFQCMFRKMFSRACLIVRWQPAQHKIAVELYINIDKHWDGRVKKGRLYPFAELIQWSTPGFEISQINYLNKKNFIFSIIVYAIGLKRFYKIILSKKTYKLEICRSEDLLLQCCGSMTFLVRIRIRGPTCTTMCWTWRSCSFYQCLSRIFKKFFGFFTFWRCTYIRLWRQNYRNQGFSHFFCLIMDGSGYKQIMMDPDHGGQKTYRSRSRSTTLPFRDERVQHERKFEIFPSSLIDCLKSKTHV